MWTRTDHRFCKFGPNHTLEVLCPVMLQPVSWLRVKPVILTPVPSLVTGMFWCICLAPFKKLLLALRLAFKPLDLKLPSSKSIQFCFLLSCIPSEWMKNSNCHRHPG